MQKGYITIYGKMVKCKLSVSSSQMVELCMVIVEFEREYCSIHYKSFKFAKDYN